MRWLWHWTKELLKYKGDYGMDWKTEVRYFGLDIDSELDNKIAYQMSFFGLERGDSGYDVEQKIRDLWFEPAIIKPTWIHINTEKQYIALIKGVEVIEEYNINQGLKWYGIAYITNKIFDVITRYSCEPKDMPDHALTGSALELNIEKFDKKCGYRNVAIHGTKSHELLPLGKNDSVNEQIIRLRSDGCVLLNNDDIFYIYENVEIGCPVVFDKTDVFMNLIPSEILTWCHVNKIQDVVEPLAKKRLSKGDQN